MSELLVALLLLVPIVIVVAILNHSHKKQKRKSQDKVAAYLQKIIGQAEIIPTYQKQLVHQLVIVDEKNGKLLIIDHRNATLSHDVFLPDDIKSTKVFNHKETLVSNGNVRKSEAFTTQLGVEITIERTGAQKFLTLYDHIQHNIYHLAELEKEAGQLQERIAKVKNSKLVKALL